MWTITSVYIGIISVLTYKLHWTHVTAYTLLTFNEFIAKKIMGSCKIESYRKEQKFREENLLRVVVNNTDGCQSINWSLNVFICMISSDGNRFIIKWINERQSDLFPFLFLNFFQLWCVNLAKNWQVYQQHHSIHHSILKPARNASYTQKCFWTAWGTWICGRLEVSFNLLLKDILLEFVAVDRKSESLQYIL